VFVWDVLSAQTTASRRDAALAALKRIPALTPDAIWRASHKKLEEAVVLAGPYLEQRVSALREGVGRFRRVPRLAELLQGPLLPARRAIRSLPHPGGDAGAHRLLLFGGEHLVFPVDAGVHRVAQRLGLASRSANLRRSVRGARRTITSGLRRDTGAWREAFLYLSHHAASTCTDGEPHCTVCPLVEMCPEGSLRVSSAKPHGAGAS
jgi:endonuclease III